MKIFLFTLLVLIVASAVFIPFYIKSKKASFKPEELYWFIYQPNDTLIFSGSEGVIDTFIISKTDNYNTGIELFSIEYTPHGFNDPAWAYINYVLPGQTLERTLMQLNKSCVDVPTCLSINFETFAYFSPDISKLRFDDSVLVNAKVYDDVEVFNDQHNTDSRKTNNWGPTSIRAIYWSKKKGLVKYSNWENQEFVRIK